MIERLYPSVVRHRPTHVTCKASLGRGLHSATVGARSQVAKVCRHLFAEVRPIPPISNSEMVPYIVKELSIEKGIIKNKEIPISICFFTRTKFKANLAKLPEVKSIK
ncbi:MAG: hypothetical protein ACUVWO_00460 [Thermodesulfobacteriota bacterium]